MNLQKTITDRVDVCIARITGLLPTMTPDQAQQLINDANGLQNQLEDSFQKLQNLKVSLGRVVRGDTRYDAHNQQEAVKTFAKLAQWDRGESPFQQAEANFHQEMDAQREEMAQRARQAKQRRDAHFEEMQRYTGVRR